MLLLSLGLVHRGESQEPPPSVPPAVSLPAAGGDTLLRAWVLGLLLLVLAVAVVQVAVARV